MRSGLIDANAPTRHLDTATRARGTRRARRGSSERLALADSATAPAPRRGRRGGRAPRQIRRPSSTSSSMPVGGQEVGLGLRGVGGRTGGQLVDGHLTGDVLATERRRAGRSPALVRPVGPQPLAPGGRLGQLGGRGAVVDDDHPARARRGSRRGGQPAGGLALVGHRAPTGASGARRSAIRRSWSEPGAAPRRAVGRRAASATDVEPDAHLGPARSPRSSRPNARLSSSSLARTTPVTRDGGQLAEAHDASVRRSASSAARRHRVRRPRRRRREGQRRLDQRQVVAVARAQRRRPLDEDVAQRPGAGRRGGQHGAGQGARPGAGLDDHERVGLTQLDATTRRAPGPPRRRTAARPRGRSGSRRRRPAAPAAGVEAVVGVVQRQLDDLVERDRAPPLRSGRDLSSAGVASGTAAHRAD